MHLKTKFLKFVETHIMMKTKFLFNLHFFSRKNLKRTNVLKYSILPLFIVISTASFSQNKNVSKEQPLKVEAKINDSIPTLIPQKRNGKFGYINQQGKIMISPAYVNVGFFTEDCNLLNSPNEKVRKFGTKKYASVSNSKHDFRIDENGKKVYQFNKKDLGQCDQTYTNQKYKAYHLRDFYGVIDVTTFKNPEDYRHFKIYPQYQYLYILVGDDMNNPMVIATKNDSFGIVDVNNKTIIPFEYADIKRNFSWKLARLFEVTKDGKNYYFVDAQNKAY